jgi:uncharacterized protein
VKVVLDTNILWVSIARRSESHWVFEALIDEIYTLCVTSDILSEYEEIISQKLGENTANSVLEIVDNLTNVELITTFYRWTLIRRDPDDDKFVDCAIACNADYLVTNDKHFNLLKKLDFPKVEVINLEEFKKLMSR